MHSALYLLASFGIAVLIPFFGFAFEIPAWHMPMRIINQFKSRVCFILFVLTPAPLLQVRLVMLNESGDSHLHQRAFASMEQQSTYHIGRDASAHRC